MTTPTTATTARSLTGAGRPCLKRYAVTLRRIDPGNPAVAVWVRTFYTNGPSTYPIIGLTDELDRLAELPGTVLVSIFDRAYRTVQVETR